MSPTPHDIQTKEFREAFRGYNQDDVDQFLDEIAEDAARMAQESQRLRVQVAALQQEVARLEEGGAAPFIRTAPEARGEARDEMKRALSAAQSAAESLLQEARTKADEIIAEAERRSAEASARVEALSRSEPNTPFAARPATGDETDLEDAQRRLEELRRQELEIRARIRSVLEEQLQMLDKSEAESHQAATVERMSRELSEGSDSPEPNPRRFWKEPEA